MGLASARGLKRLVICWTILSASSAAPAGAYSSTDIIATYAGSGTQGYVGDGGPAATAELNFPAYLAADAAGNLYISDVGSHTIRKVDTGGIITTIAGTGTAGYNGDGIAATTAQLNRPLGIAFDSNGDLFIADSSNQRIRKITMSTGQINTVAGTGNAGCFTGIATLSTVSGPAALAFDVNDTLYFSESGNRIVRKLSGGSLSTYLGSCGTAVFGAPNAMAISPGGNVYIGDQSTRQVKEFDSNGTLLLTIGNGSSGNAGDGSVASSSGVSLNPPGGLTCDASGDVFIGSGPVVRVVTADGIIHTAAGDGTAGYAGDGAMATSAQIGAAAGLAIGNNGSLYLADIGSHVNVRIVGPAAPLIVSVKPGPPNVIPDAVHSADGRIQCSGSTGSCGANYVAGMPVILLTPSANAVYEWTAAGCRGFSPSCTVNPDQASPTSVGAYFTGKIIDTFLGGAAGPTLNQPYAVAVDDGGNLFFSETTSCTVRKRIPSGAVVPVAGNGICGNIGDGMPATLAELDHPQGIAIDAAGNVFIQDAANAVVRKVTSDGVLHTFATGLYPTDLSPAIVLDAQGNLYMATSAHQITRVAPDGTQHAFATISPSEIAGLAPVPGGDLIAYGSNAGAQTFTLVSATGYVWSTRYVGQQSNVVPAGVAVDQDGGIYFGYGTCGIIASNIWFDLVPLPLVTQLCSDSGDGGRVESAHVDGPLGLAIDQKGFMYIASSMGNAIRVVYPDAMFTGDFDQQ